MKLCLSQHKHYDLSISMTDENNVQSKLEAVAEQYHHSQQQQQTLLDPLKNPVLIMRAKYASYDIITEILHQHGVRVSDTTVRKFCRKHHSEMLRIRSNVEARRIASAQSFPVEPSAQSKAFLPSLEHTQRQSLTIEPGKRAPRIARDIL